MVRAGRSGSRLVQPRALMESRNEAEAMGKAGDGVLRVRTAEDFVQMMQMPAGTEDLNRW